MIKVGETQKVLRHMLQTSVHLVLFLSKSGRLSNIVLYNHVLVTGSFIACQVEELRRGIPKCVQGRLLHSSGNLDFHQFDKSGGGGIFFSIFKISTQRQAHCTDSLLVQTARQSQTLGLCKELVWIRLTNTRYCSLQRKIGECRYWSNCVVTVSGRSRYAWGRRSYTLWRALPVYMRFMGGKGSGIFRGFKKNSGTHHRCPWVPPLLLPVAGGRVTQDWE